MSYQAIEVEPVAAALGAEVRGVDLARPLDEPTHKELVEAWMQYQVLFFRDQPLSTQQHKDFAARFGALHVHPVLQPLKDQGHPEIVVLENTPERPYLAQAWHSDVTFEQEPPMGSVLRAIEVPPYGCDTMWASMYAAYEALSDTMQRLLSGLEAIHDEGFFRMLAKPEQRKKFEEAPKTVHPVIRTHPVTGRPGIFVNSGFTRSIRGMKPAESQTLLRFLFRHVGSPEFTCRFRWRQDSVAMWDNRCTQHMVVPDNPTAYRHMQRVTLQGDRPIGAPAPA